MIVDEAQNLSAEVLEQVRLLTNLETPTQKLLQIILIGQPELRVLLDRTDLRQLAQRITGRYHLEPLSREETRGYVRHRLRVAGATEEIFTPAALAEVHRLAAGIPRVINVTCDRALLGAYTQEMRKITPALVRLAAGEVYGRRFLPLGFRWLAGVLGLIGVAGIAFFGWYMWQRQSPHNASRPNTAATLPPLAPAKSPPHTTQPGDPSPAAAPTAMPAAAPTAASINALLAANSANTGDAAAFRRLLSLWGTAMADDKRPLRSGGEGRIVVPGAARLLGASQSLEPACHPDADGRSRATTPRGAVRLGRSVRHLEFGRAQRACAPRRGLAGLVREFTVVWKPKTVRTRLLTVGMRGDEVRWLRRSLNALQGAASDPEYGDVYDEELAIAVQNFQREHRLNVDGIAGVQTQLVLDTALAEPGSPLLLANAPRGT